MSVLSWILPIYLSRSVSIAQDEVHDGTVTIFSPVLKASEEWRLCCLVLISHGLRWVFNHLFAVRVDANYLSISVVLEFLRSVRNFFSWLLYVKINLLPPLVRERVGLCLDKNFGTYFT